MRRDVKLGVVFSIGVVLIGGLYLYRDDPEDVIPVGGTALTQRDGRPADPLPPPLATTRSPSFDQGSETTLPGRSNPSSEGRLASSPPAPRPIDPDSPATGGDQKGRQPKLSAANPEEKPAPAPPPAQIEPEGVTNERHRVQPGDTFVHLAEMYYGSERYAPFLAAANPAVEDTGPIAAGTLIEIPEAPALPPVTQPTPSPVRSPRASAPKPRTYQVKEGDSFYQIAQRLLGDASRWQELLELNSDLVKGDPRKLRAGKVIVLPDRE